MNLGYIDGVSIKNNEVRLILPPQFKEALKNKAARFGLKQSQYVRELLFEDLKNEAIFTDPEYEEKKGLTEKELYDREIRKLAEALEKGGKE